MTIAQVLTYKNFYRQQKQLAVSGPTTRLCQQMRHMCEMTNDVDVGKTSRVVPIAVTVKCFQTAFRSLPVGKGELSKFGLKLYGARSGLKSEKNRPELKILIELVVRTHADARVQQLPFNQFRPLVNPYTYRKRELLETQHPLLD